MSKATRALVALCALAWGCAGLPGGSAPLGGENQVTEIQITATGALLSGSRGFFRARGVTAVCLGVAAQSLAGTVMGPDAPVRRVPTTGLPERDREATRQVIALLRTSSLALVPNWECRPDGRAWVVEETGTEAVLVRVDSPQFTSTDFATQTAVFDHEDFTYSMSCRVVLDSDGWFVDSCRCRRSRGPDACLSIG